MTETNQFNGSHFSIVLQHSLPELYNPILYCTSVERWHFYGFNVKSMERCKTKDRRYCIEVKLWCICSLIHDNRVQNNTELRTLHSTLIVLSSAASLSKTFQAHPFIVWKGIILDLLLLHARHNTSIHSIHWSCSCVGPLRCFQFIIAHAAVWCVCLALYRFELHSLAHLFIPSFVRLHVGVCECVLCAQEIITFEAFLMPFYRIKLPLFLSTTYQ